MVVDGPELIMTSIAVLLIATALSALPQEKSLEGKSALDFRESWKFRGRILLNVSVDHPPLFLKWETLAYAGTPVSYERALL